MFSSLYIGETGMKAHEQGMSVVGNNIANVNTTAFKSSRAHFGTLLSDNQVASQDDTVGYSQIGQGVGLQDVTRSLNQGAFTPTNTSTNMAIAGKGYFRVTSGTTTNYTRAGNFLFDTSGYLVDPNGYRLQGQAITDGSPSGTTTDIQIAPDATTGLITIPASQTTEVASFHNLGTSGDNSADATDPFFAVAKAWDGTTTTGLQSNEYAHSTTVQMYDANGAAREFQIYFDPVDASTLTNPSSGHSYWEYTVAIPPGQEGRAGFQNTDSAGLLMAGTLEFDSEGTLLSQSAFTNASGTEGLANWSPSSFTANGYPQLDITYSDGTTFSVGLNLGLKSTNSTWTNTNAANAIGTDPSQLPSSTTDRAVLATSALSGSSSTKLTRQDGYPVGELQNINIDNDGVLSGTYSNGQSQDLWQIQLYTFSNEYGLRSNGNNHYVQTAASGTAVEGLPGQSGLGAINNYNLENSNVELATEFVNMITTQRGFQANGKIITTSDTMIQSALNMKR